MKLKLESKMYQFYELRTRCQHSIEQADSLLVGLEKLIKLIEDSTLKDDKDVAVYYDALLHQKEESIKGKELFNKKLLSIETLIKMYEKGDDNSKLLDQIVALVFDGLNLSTESSVEQEESTEE